MRDGNSGPYSPISPSGEFQHSSAANARATSTPILLPPPVSVSTASWASPPLFTCCKPRRLHCFDELSEAHPAASPFPLALLDALLVGVIPSRLHPRVDFARDRVRIRGCSWVPPPRKQSSPRSFRPVSCAYAAASNRLVISGPLTQRLLDLFINSLAQEIARSALCTLIPCEYHLLSARLDPLPYGLPNQNPPRQAAPLLPRPTAASPNLHLAVYLLLFVGSSRPQVLQNGPKYPHNPC